MSEKMISVDQLMTGNGMDHSRVEALKDLLWFMEGFRFGHNSDDTGLTQFHEQALRDAVYICATVAAIRGESETREMPF